MHVRRARSERGVAMLEMVLGITLGSVALVSMASAWGSIALWMGKVQAHATLLREARLTREYLEKDLLANGVVPPVSPESLLLLAGDGTTILYELRDDKLWRETSDGREMLVAVALGSAEFIANVDAGRLTTSIVFTMGGISLSLDMETREQVAGTLFVGG